jgi:eukaryotic-like serine/threonine-protein kinase
MTTIGNMSTLPLAAGIAQLSLDSIVTSEIRKRWDDGQFPDLAALLETHPEIKPYRSFVLDLAHEEYSRRLAGGESIDAEEYSKQFPSYQKSLYFLIEVHKLLAHDPEFLSPADISWPAIGEDFLGFAIRSELGRGTFARVYIASESALGGRIVAVKVALHGSGEANTLGRLKHPNIVPVYSVQEDIETGLTAICMPYLGRTTLCDVLDRAFSNKQLPQRSQIIVETIRRQNADANADLKQSSFHRILRNGPYIEGIVHLAVQLTEALEYTHSCGICHGDLKPSNVLLSLEGRPLLLDFNLSVERQFGSGRIGGTLPYMAPEQLAPLTNPQSDGGVRTAPQTDIFALGVILYHLLTGDLPFKPASWDAAVEQVAEQLRKEQAKGPCAIRTKNNHVSRRLEKLIHSCLAFNPQQRPSSASELKEALRKELAPFRRALRWCQYHRRLAASIACMSMAIILLCAAFFLLRPPYNARQFQSGMLLYQQGKYEAAIECFNNSLQTDKNQPDVLFARGRAYLKAGSYGVASEDFRISFRLCPSSETMVCRAYCISKLGHHREAVEYYLKALSLGYKSPLMLHDLGFSCYQSSQHDRAADFLQQALAVKSDLQASHHVLMLLELNKSLNGKPVSREALEHAQKALELGPPAGDLYYAVSTLYACAAKDSPEMKQAAANYAQKALDYGIDPQTIIDTPALSFLQKDQQFKELLTRQPGSRPLVKSEYLVDPLGDR